MVVSGEVRAPSGCWKVTGTESRLHPKLCVERDQVWAAEQNLRLGAGRSCVFDRHADHRPGDALASMGGVHQHTAQPRRTARRSVEGHVPQQPSRGSHRPTFGNSGEGVLLVVPHQSEPVHPERVGQAIAECGLITRRTGAQHMDQLEVRTTVVHRHMLRGGRAGGVKPEAQTMQAAGLDSPVRLGTQAAQYRDRGCVVGQDEREDGREREAAKRQVQARTARLAGDPTALGQWLQGEAEVNSVPGPIAQPHPAQKRVRCSIPDREVAVAVSGPVGDVVVAHGPGRRPTVRPAGRQPSHDAVLTDHSLKEIVAVPAADRLHHKPLGAQNGAT